MFVASIVVLLLLAMILLFQAIRDVIREKTSDLPDFVVNSFSTGGATDLFSNKQSDYFLTTI